MLRRHIRPPRLALAGVVLVAILALAPATVLGHSELESADPAANGTVTESPTLIVANFTERVDPARSSMELRGPDGAVIAKGGVAPGDPEAVQMTITPPAPLGVGTYEVRWTTVTPDDNGIERGTYTITVTAPPTQAPATPVASPASPAAASAEPSATPEASGSPEESIAPSASATAAATVASSAAGGGSGGGSGDSGPNLLAIATLAAVLAVVVGVAAWFVARRRPA